MMNLTEARTKLLNTCQVVARNLHTNPNRRLTEEEAAILKDTLAYEDALGRYPWAGGEFEAEYFDNLNKTLESAQQRLGRLRHYLTREYRRQTIDNLGGDGQLQEAPAERPTKQYRDPKPWEVNTPLFNDIWSVIKHWDISRMDSDEAGLYSGATGSDVVAIMDALYRNFPRRMGVGKKDVFNCFWVVKSINEFPSALYAEKWLINYCISLGVNVADALVEKDERERG